MRVRRDFGPTYYFERLNEGHISHVPRVPPEPHEGRLSSQAWKLLTDPVVNLGFIVHMGNRPFPLGDGRGLWKGTEDEVLQGWDP